MLAGISASSPSKRKGHLCSALRGRVWVAALDIHAKAPYSIQGQICALYSQDASGVEAARHPVESRHTLRGLLAGYGLDVLVASQPPVDVDSHVLDGTLKEQPNPIKQWLSLYCLRSSRRPGDDHGVFYLARSRPATPSPTSLLPSAAC